MNFQGQRTARAFTTSSKGPLMDTVRTDSIPAPARQDVAERYQDDASDRDAAITKMLTNPNPGAGQAAPAPYYEPAAISPDLSRAIEAHRRAQQAFLHAPNVHDNDLVDTTVEQLTAFGDAIRAIPAQSLADLRCKTIYLWPGSLKGEIADDEFADTLNSFRDDVERLAAAGDAPGGLIDADLTALGRQFDEAHDAWREAVEANREPSARYAAFLDAARKRGRPTMKDVQEAWELPGVAAAGDAEDETFGSVAELGLQTLRLEAISIASLALKARCVIPNLWMDGSYEADAALGEHEDVHREAVRLLIESCCAAAGVDWRGQPRAAEADSPQRFHDRDRHEYAFHGASTELRLAARELDRLAIVADQMPAESSAEAVAAAEAARDAASARQDQAWRDLFKIRPRTNHQLWLLLRDVARHFDGNQGMVDEPDVFGALVGAADSLRLASPEITARHDLTALTIVQLGELADVCRRQDRALYDASGSWCEGALTAVLDRERDRIALLGTMASAEIERRSPVDKSERDGRLETLIKADLAGNGYIEPALLAEAVAAWGTR